MAIQNTLSNDNVEIPNPVLDAYGTYCTECGIAVVHCAL